MANVLAVLATNQLPLMLTKQQSKRTQAKAHKHTQDSPAVFHGHVT